MLDAEIILLNQEGFVPGPGEGEASFLQRVSLTKEAYVKGSWIPESHWDWVRQFLNDLFDVKPLYIGVFYSNKHLRFWEGAACWMGEVQTIQLREGLKKGTYLGLYNREEILAHEAIHAIRGAFDEKSEEFFAYIASRKKWRRVLGPIVQRPWEVWPFFLSLIGGTFFPICYLAAAIWISIGFCRLSLVHRRFNKAAREIMKVVLDARRTRAILFRLTDQEILAFANGAKIKEYAKEQTCLRWRLIRLAYLG